MDDDRELYARTIAELADICGSYETLATMVNANVDDLCQWAEGRSRPPIDVFLRLVNVKESSRKIQAR
jgi:hypothetical protein